MYALMNKLATLGLFAGGLANTFGDTGDELTASGTTQADAFESNTGILRFTTVAAGTGVKLDNGSKGDCQLIINDGLETLNVYPPSDQQIEGMGLNTAVTLAPGEAGAFYRITTARWSVARTVGNIAAQVTSYAQLRQYRGPAIAINLNALRIGGVFIRDSSDVTTADNGATVLVGAGGVRWKRLFNGVMLSSWWTPDLTGNVDCTAEVQAAIDLAMTSGSFALELEAGSYRVSTIQIRSTVGYKPLRIVGAQGSFLGKTEFIHAPTETLNPILNIQAVRDVIIESILFEGRNLAPSLCAGGDWTNFDPAAWNTGGFSERRRAPYAGVVIDGLSGADPGAGNNYTFAPYVGLGFTSSKVTFIDCRFQAFVTGVVVNPTVGAVGTEKLMFRECQFIENKYAIALCGSQQREVVLDNCDFNGHFAQIDTITFGDQQGPPPAIIGGIHAKCCRMFQLTPDIGHLQMTAGYLESVASLGMLGTTTNTSACSAEFNGVNFSLIGKAANSGETNKDLLLVCGMPTLFNGCMFTGQFNMLVYPLKPVRFEGCEFRCENNGLSTVPGDRENFGIHTAEGEEGLLSFVDCRQRVYPGTTKYFDDCQKSSTAALPSRAYVAPNTRELSLPGRTQYAVIPPANETRNATITAASITYSTEQVTFTETTSPRIIRAGDQLYWRVFSPVVPGAAAITKIVPALKVLSVDGAGLVTCQITAADIDTSYAPAVAAIRMRLFVNANVATGNTTNGVATVTMANAANFQQNDWVTTDDASLVQYLRVESVVGSTVTFHRTLNATRPGVSFFNCKIFSLTARVDGVELADYTALRAYNGAAKTVVITGFLGTAAPSPIAGTFTRDDVDNTSIDDGGTVIVTTAGKRWKRVYDGPINVCWFGATGNGVTDDTTAVHAAMDLAKATGNAVYFPPGVYRVTTQYTNSTIRGNMALLGPTRTASDINDNLGAIVLLDNATATVAFYEAAAAHNLFVDNLRFRSAQFATDRDFFRFTGTPVNHRFKSVTFENVTRPIVYKAGSYAESVSFSDVLFWNSGTIHSDSNVGSRGNLFVLNNVYHGGTTPALTDKIVCNLQGIRGIQATNFLLQGSLPSAGWEVLRLDNEYDPDWGHSPLAQFNGFWSEWSVNAPTYVVRQHGGMTQWNNAVLNLANTDRQYKLEQSAQTRIVGASFTAAATEVNDYFAIEDSKCNVVMVQCAMRLVDETDERFTFENCSFTVDGNASNEPLGAALMNNSQGSLIYKWDGGYVNGPATLTMAAGTATPSTDATYGRRLMLTPAGNALTATLAVPLRGIMTQTSQYNIVALIRLPTFATGTINVQPIEDAGVLSGGAGYDTTFSGQVVKVHIARRIAGAAVATVGLRITSAATGVALTCDVLAFAMYLGNGAPRLEYPSYPNRIETENTAAPAAGTWVVGDRVSNSAPAVGSPKAWRCTVAGTPGTWVSEGNL